MLGDINLYFITPYPRRHGVSLRRAEVDIQDHDCHADAEICEGQRLFYLHNGLELEWLILDKPEGVKNHGKKHKFSWRRKWKE